MCLTPDPAHQRMQLTLLPLTVREVCYVSLSCQGLSMFSVSVCGFYLLTFHCYYRFVKQLCCSATCLMCGLTTTFCATYFQLGLFSSCWMVTHPTFTLTLFEWQPSTKFLCLRSLPIPPIPLSHWTKIALVH